MAKTQPKTQTPAQAPVKKKRPKFAPGSGTPKQRRIIVGLAVACVIAAFLIPPSKEEAEAPKPRPPGIPPPKPAAAAGVFSTAPRVSTGGGGALIEGAEPPLPKVAEITAAGARTPKEVDYRIKQLEPYFAQAGGAEVKAAYAALLELGPALAERLPKLIETTDHAALPYYAKAAVEMKAAAVIPALINRLGSKGKKRVAQDELMKTLGSFDDDRARKFLSEAIQGSDPKLAEAAWGALGQGLSPAQLDLVFKTAAGGGQHAFRAAETLVRYASDGDKTREVSQRIELALPQAKGEGRVALIEVLSGIDTSVTGSVLVSLAQDEDIRARRAVLRGLARSPTFRGMVLNGLRDENPAIKAAAAAALAENPEQAYLEEYLAMLRDAELAGYGHAALVKLANGNDLGWQDFQWQAWFETQKRPKVKPAEAPPRPK